MPTINYGVSLSGAGVSIQGQAVRTVENPDGYEVALPVGKAGTLSTRTDDNTGEATLGASHGITTGMIVDVYWDGGVRYGMTVGTVDVNDVPLDGGAGDNLPTQATAIVVTEQVIVNTTLDGDALNIIGIMLKVAAGATGKGHVDFQDAANDSIKAMSLVGNSPYVNDIDGGQANAFTGDPITHCHASNGSSTVAGTLQIVAGADATP